MADDDLVGGEAPQAGAGGQTLDKRVLLKRIVTTTGLSAAQARKILDTALDEIAQALDEGNSVAVPPLGKLRPVRKAEQGGTSVHTLRLRRTPPLARLKAAGGGDGAAAEDDIKPGAKARARVRAGAAGSRAGGGKQAAGKGRKTVAAPDDDDDN